jgi:hypothetical protein
MKIGNGVSTSFWLDKWCGDEPLSMRYKRLFELSLNKEINVNWAIRDNCNSLIFRRRLFGDGVNLLDDLKNNCADFCLIDRNDKPCWLLDKKGFSVKSSYRNFKVNLNRDPYWFIWKAKIPQRIKVFLWLVINDKILSKENLRKKNGKGTLIVSGVVVLKQPAISFIIARLHLFLGKLFRCPVRLLHFPKVLRICLGVGYVNSKGMKKI